MSRFVLVHGAWQGGWCWQRLAAELEGRGHAVETPDLPSEDVILGPRDYARGLGDCADAVVVGHSLGGLTIGLVDARVHVYLSAILPIEGGYARSLRPDFGGSLRDELGRSYWPDLETAAARLYPDCDRATVEWAFGLLRRQAPLTPEPVEFGAGDVWVGCLRDIAIDPGAGRALLARSLELDAGHFPMLTRPRETADLLESIASSV